MKNRITYRIIFLLLLWNALCCGSPSFLSAQTLKMALSKEITMAPMDMDAMSYFPVKDQNDELCALIKVKTSNELKNPLILDNGAVGVTRREERPNGEYWFWVPYQTKNLFFSCKGYESMDPIPVQLVKGKVYRVEIQSDAVIQTVTNATISFNYLRMHIEPAGATVSIGSTPECSMYTEALTDSDFFYQLNFGEYYYRIEHPLYETMTGKYTVSDQSETLEIQLQPAFSHLRFTSEPEGAQVFVDGVYLGTTPVQTDQKFVKGQVAVRMQKQDYGAVSERVEVIGNGLVQDVHLVLDAQFATVTCISEDPQAEIWLDNEFRGIGSWTGHVGTRSSHVLEARKTGHQSQSVSFSVQIGETSSHRVGAPVPLYGILSIESKPANAEIWIDGTLLGTTPKVSQLLVGSHQVVIRMPGYRTITEEITIEHNQRQVLARQLETSTDVVTDSGTGAGSGAGAGTGTQVGAGSGAGSFVEGPAQQQQAYSLQGTTQNSPKPQSQRLFVVEFNGAVGFESDPLVRNFSANLYGGTLGYLSGHWGGYLTGLYGLEYGDFAVTVGPVYERWNMQFFAGVGVIKGELKTSFLADVGLRVEVISILDLSVSCKLSSGYLVPTVGIGLVF